MCAEAGIGPAVFSLDHFLAGCTAFPRGRTGRVFLDESDHFSQKDYGPLSEGVLFTGS
jgi:hypothetical protein